MYLIASTFSEQVKKENKSCVTFSHTGPPQTRLWHIALCDTTNLYMSVSPYVVSCLTRTRLAVVLMSMLLKLGKRDNSQIGIFTSPSHNDYPHGRPLQTSPPTISTSYKLFSMGIRLQASFISVREQSKGNTAIINTLTFVTITRIRCFRSRNDELRLRSDHPTLRLRSRPRIQVVWIVSYLPPNCVVVVRL